MKATWRGNWIEVTIFTSTYIHTHTSVNAYIHILHTYTHPCTHISIHTQTYTHIRTLCFQLSNFTLQIINLFRLEGNVLWGLLYFLISCCYFIPDNQIFIKSQILMMKFFFRDKLDLKIGVGTSTSSWHREILIRRKW